LKNVDTGYQHTRLFKSQYACYDNRLWGMILHFLQLAGHTIHMDMQPCSKAIILGGYMENPSAFRDIYTKVYTFNAGRTADIWYQIIDHYYDEIVDVTDMDTDLLINQIVEEIERDNQNRRTA